MPLGAKLNLEDVYLTSSLQLAGIPLADAASIYNRNWFLVGFAHVAGRDGKVRRAAQAFQYGYSDLPKDARPGVTEAIHAHMPRRAYGPAFFYSEAVVHSFEDQSRIWDIVADADTAWMHAPHGYFVTEVALDSLQPRAVPTCWIVTQPGRLAPGERARLERYAPVVSADSAVKISPIRAAGKGKAWGFVDQDSSLVVVVTNTDTAATDIRVDIAGLPQGPFPLVDALSGAGLGSVSDSGKPSRSILVHLASREARPFVVQGAFVKGPPVGLRKRPDRTSAGIRFEHGGPAGLRLPCPTSDGGIRWIDIHGRPVP